MAALVVLVLVLPARPAIAATNAFGHIPAGSDQLAAALAESESNLVALQASVDQINIEAGLLTVAAAPLCTGAGATRLDDGGSALGEVCAGIVRLGETAAAARAGPGSSDQADGCDRAPAHSVPDDHLAPDHAAAQATLPPPATLPFLPVDGSDFCGSVERHCQAASTDGAGTREHALCVKAVMTTVLGSAPLLEAVRQLRHRR